MSAHRNPHEQALRVCGSPVADAVESASPASWQLRFRNVGGLRQICCSHTPYGWAPVADGT